MTKEQYTQFEKDIEESIKYFESIFRQKLIDFLLPFEEILNKTSVNAKDKKECEEYIAWQNKHKLKKIKPIEFTSYVDKLLFTLGKYLKNANIKRQKI